jgi:hypothetical protein
MRFKAFLALVLVSFGEVDVIEKFIVCMTLMTFYFEIAGKVMVCKEYSRANSGKLIFL